MRDENRVEKVIYRAEEVKRYFRVRVRRGRTRLFQTRKWLPAVDGVSFELKAARTLAIVGESGCGKSTLARVLLRLIEPTGGRLYFRGRDLCALSANDLRLAREHVQMIFQDPYSSLHPRRTVANIIAEPWRIHPQLAPASFKERIIELLDQVGLSEEYMRAYPGRLSGGERQRISIARALAMKPEILILDEPVSALDVSIQAQIIRLIMELQQKLGIAYVFISHDLPLVRLVADEVAVMYMGRFVEMGQAEEIFAHPRHPYTQLLLNSSAERVDLERPGGASEPTSPLDLPRGCRFQPRCPKAQAICSEREPGLEVGRSGDHLCACHFPGQ
jgi:oligopeptide/dipeptide ABC transporter ATP-binding protein